MPENIEADAEFDADNWLPFDETKSYYRDELQAGRRPLLFHGVRHVLVSGALALRRLTIVELE